MYTDYQSQFWAHALTLKSASDSVHNLSRSIANAKVDLNPHQVDAALFAFRSPLARGAILADEVGLGKTIEAGIVLAQRWAERRRRILLILPATLRKQWQQEIEEKFFLPTIVLESRNFNQFQRDGQPNPFEQDGRIVACSYHFASAKAQEIRQVTWDLVVIDEAHRLRNVYKTGNKMARNIADAVEQAPKLLLTATPLQNSMMELYGLVSIIDPHIFGNKKAFERQFSRLRHTSPDNSEEQGEKASRLFRRGTLRSFAKVIEYIVNNQGDKQIKVDKLCIFLHEKGFTHRLPTEVELASKVAQLNRQREFPNGELNPHYGKLTSFLELNQLRSVSTRANNNSFNDLKERLAPICKRTLRKQVLEYIRFTNRVPITQDFLPSDEEHYLYQQVSAYLQREMLLALPSSQRMLMTMILRKLLASSSFAIGGTLRRLVVRLEGLLAKQVVSDTAQIEEDVENLDELEDEWEEEPAEEPEIDPALIREELAELTKYADLADAIGQNAKGTALLSALRIAFEKADTLGAKRKAVIFTESRRTQDYLFDLLSKNGYAGNVVLLNGTNTDPHSRELYEQWCKRHESESTVTGLRAVDTKAAIVEEFRDRATLMIATEAGAEGINLQFASLVVNYDLPWNPQRIEQRIGRCHRYGQQHDVVVVNFLNRRNEADLRVFQLLSEKFQLFDGVFGASDEVLGALESGVDIERRIAQVYQDCRTTEEIQSAFDKLQAELEEQIQSRMAQTREALLDNFDEEVHARLKVHRKQAFSSLSDRERWLLALTQHELADQATFNPKQPRFFYTGEGFRKGNYNLDWKQAEKDGDTFYRADHPLAVKLIERAKQRELGVADVTFDYAAHGSRIAALEKYRGASGWLELSKLTVQSFESEEFLVFAAVTDDGQRLDSDMCYKLLNLPASAVNESSPGPSCSSIDNARKLETERCVKQVDDRNGLFFDEEVAKLERWSDDLKLGLERDIKDLDQRIKEIRRESQAATALTEKLAAQKRLKSAESERNKKRRDLYDAQDAIDQQREALIAKIEGQLRMSENLVPLFTLRWSLA